VTSPPQQPALAANSPIDKALTLDTILGMSEMEVFEAFKRIRWKNTQGQPRCPRCGCDVLYTCKAESLWKCKGCSYRFSVTSGTIFASRKLPLRDLLAAIAVLTNEGENHSAMKLSHDLDVQYKTAWELAHRIRDAMDSSKIGPVTIDDIEVAIPSFGKQPKPADSNQERPPPADALIHDGNPPKPTALKAEPADPLAKLKRTVLVIGEPAEWAEGDKDFQAGLVMLAPLEIGSMDPAAVSAFTGVPERLVREYAGRLAENGIWRPDGKIAADWCDPEYGNFAFMMDVWVATGSFNRGKASED
jgi:transposase-like protein